MMEVSRSTIDAAAIAAYEAHRAYCLAIGDNADPPWNSATLEQQASFIKGVRAVIAGKTPEAIHALWAETKLAAGWSLGARDEAAKTHPNLVPHSELDRYQQQKSVIFFATVKLFLKCLG